MKIAYLGSFFISDSEFPLFREFQRQKLDITIYLPLVGKKCNGSIFDIDSVKKIDTIIPASDYREFSILDGYLDLSNIYIINNYHNKIYHWQSWVIWIKFLFHIKKKGCNILHYVWPLQRQKNILFLSQIKKVMTVHDPIPHSSHLSEKIERLRRKNFKKVDSFLLLNDMLKENFIKRYNIIPSKVFVSNFGFGFYGWINHLYKKGILQPQERYLLFCGQIQEHKGVDILLKAMKIVHNEVKDIKCIIAGGGHLYFGKELYEDCNYIEIRNRFIPTQEMLGLIKNCLFAVCPYKDATQSGIVQWILSSGTPIIVTDVGTLPIAVKDGITGLVVPPSDSETLAKAIIELANNNELRNKLEDNIDRIWKSEDSWAEIVNVYLDLYVSLSNN